MVNRLKKEVIRMYLYKKIEIFFIVMLVTLLTGCGGGGASSGDLSIQAEETVYAQVGETITTSKAVHQGQITDSVTGKALANVVVTIGSHTTTTDANGYYTLSDLSRNEEAVVTFEKGGYLVGSKKIQIKILSEDDTVSPNYLEYTMHAKNYQWDYHSNDEVTGAHVMIDASVSYDSINSKSYNGTNTAELIYFDITSDEGKAAFPGDFKGINSNGTMVQFDSYGLISILLKDSNGNILRLAESETVTLRFDSVSSLGKQETLPLWYYDYEQGLWFEEGYAQLQEDGSYKGGVSHLGAWSLNRVLEDEPGLYSGRIIDKDGSPMSEVRVYAVGENWIGSDLTTDEDGRFEIEVIPGKSFKLKAYNYKDKYEAKYNDSISAISSGEIVEE
jgi:hypothetical protein